MKQINKQSGFTLIELLITVSLMVIIGSFTTASLMSSARTQNAVKNAKDVQGQVDRVVEKIGSELKTSEKSQTILTNKQLGTLSYSAGVANDLVVGADGYDKSPNSILMYTYNNHDEDGNIITGTYIKIICLRQDEYDGKIIGQRLVQYSLKEPNNPFGFQRAPSVNPECTEAYVGTLFPPAKNNITTTYLTEPSVQLNYFRATPLIMNKVFDPARTLDVNPDAISLEISAVYNDLNSNVKRLGERVQKSKQSLYVLKTTLLTK